MKKTYLAKNSVLFLSVIFITVMTAACGKKSTAVQFNFTSHKDGSVVSRSLPLKMSGTVVNYDKLDAKLKNNLHVYLIEQSTKEKIWHIEPEGTLDSKGIWRAITWLGNPRQGNHNIFNVCVFATDEILELNDGDHPVKEKPDFLGEACITVRRVDR